MKKAGSVHTTSADLLLGGYQKAYNNLSDVPNDYAEAKGDEIAESATAHAQAVWSKPTGTSEAAIERAKVAFYLNADTIGENGSICFTDYKHLDTRERANAELILAMLALDKKKLDS